MAENKKTVTFIIERQDGPNDKPYTQEFEVAYRPGLNVVASLMEIQKNPVTKDGKKVAPVVWECNCLEEVCGACAMMINGKPRQACSCLVDSIPQPIRLAPLSKFPVVRDLMVDRQKMFDNLKKVQAWVAIDTTANLGPGPRMSRSQQEEVYPLSRCMTCGCCLEACPQVNDHSAVIGASAVSQVRLFNAHPTGKGLAGDRLDALMEPGGLHECGNAQNCVRVCPKEIPLTDSIADVGRQITVRALKKFFTT